MTKKKYYAVKKGRIPGIYFNWEDCKKQIEKYSGAIYKGFSTLEEAAAFVEAKAQIQVVERTEEQSKNDKIENKHTNAEDENEVMIAYVDGSYNIQTKQFSYGMVILFEGKELKFAKKVEEPSLASMRNVAGEIKGAEMAMRYAIENGCRQLIIYHDYEGISRWCLGEWKANKEGTKAYKAYYDSIKDKINITFKKVKGHSGDKYNDMADELAKSVIF